MISQNGSRTKKKIRERGMFIYKTTNLINGKLYIGQTITNDPYYIGSGTILKLAIQKYGYENFTRDIVEYCINTDDLNDAEIFWIWKYDSLAPKGYNITKGGRSNNNESKMSESLTKYHFTREELNQLYITEKKTIVEIAQIYHCGSTTIHRNMNKYKITLKQGHKHRRNRKHYNSKPKFAMPKEELFQLYITENKTQREIALIYNCSRATISNLLHKYQIFKRI